MRFEFSDLNLFARVVEAGSITHGAARAHKSLAAASVRLRELEESLGTPLLVRDRLGVKPTEAGVALVAHAYRMLEAMQHLHDEMSEFTERLTGYVKIYSNSASLMDHLAAPLARFLVLHPAVDVNLEEAINHLIVDAVLEGKADFGICARPADVKSLETIPLYTDRYVVVAPSAGPLPHGGSAAFAELLDHDFVGLGRGTSIQAMLHEIARQHGKRFRHRAQLRGFDVACRMVVDGAGLALVPESVALNLRKSLDFSIVRLQDEWAELPTIICKRRDSDSSPHARMLIDFLREWSAH